LWDEEAQAARNMARPRRTAIGTMALRMAEPGRVADVRRTGIRVPLFRLHPGRHEAGSPYGSPPERSIRKARVHAPSPILDLT
jgi:hypothetical protein